MTDSERKQQKTERVEQAAEWLRAGERSGTVAKRLREEYDISARTAERDISAALEALAREETIDRDVVRQKLKVDLDWASSEAAKLIEVESAPSARPGTHARGPGREVSLTEEEARRLLAKLKGEAYYKVALALATGLRWGEIHGLAWADVDLDAQPCTVTIRRSWQGKPKTAASAATLPLNGDSAALLRRWRAEQGQPAVYIFPARDGSLRKAERRAETVTIKRAAKAAGIEKNVSPHVLRHTYGTWIYERTGDPKILQRLMRHASFQTSMGYVHDRRELAIVVNQLPAMFPARLQSV
jgi:integrase